jgi:hypothetical protein
MIAHPTSSTVVGSAALAPIRHGAYVCVRPTGDLRRLPETPVNALAARLGFENEFDATDHPAEACAFLRRIDVTLADISDERLFDAEAIVHVASPHIARVEEFCAGLLQLLKDQATLAILQGVVRPPSFTGAAMQSFAYADEVEQQPGDAMPQAFVVPMRKTTDWWAKSWMERHTYFLPRYDGSGRMVNEGHALAAAAGIPYLMRRTYRNEVEPAPEGTYDFVNYFECADAGVPVFLDVCASLRDVNRNPEWTFVREGPTWRGRRVRTWSACWF